MDFRFKHPARFFVAAPSGSGKTTLILNICRFAEHMFDEPRVKENIIYFYNEWDKNAFPIAKEEKIVKEFVNEKPTVDLFHKYVDHCEHSLVIIDDWGLKIDKEIDEIFKVTAGKTKTSVFLLSQELFETGSRGVSRNSTYIFAFKNPGDMSQIRYLARRVAPHNPRYIIDAYHDATRDPYSYLFFDMHQTTPNEYKIRSNIMPHELPMVIYAEKTR